MWLEATVGLLVWGGVWLLIDAFSARHRPVDLTERLQPYQPSVADEAESWLHRQK